MVTGPPVVNMRKVLTRKRQMVNGLISMHLDNYNASGAEQIMGTGPFTAPKTIEVDLNDGGIPVLMGERVILNVGTHGTRHEQPNPQEKRHVLEDTSYRRDRCRNGN